MKHKILSITLLYILMLFGHTYGVHANVDQTNAFRFEYDCKTNGGILKANFDLGGHHIYHRQYRINQPGIIEIRDNAHTTVSRNLNISISGCGYKADTCNIGSMSDWELDSEETYKTITILTDAKVEKIGNEITIFGEENDDTVIITGFDSEYNIKGKNIQLKLSDNIIEIFQEGETKSVRSIDFDNKIYNGMKSIYYEIAEDNKNITLKNRIFRRQGEGNTRSSKNTHDIYKAFTGNNFGYPISSKNDEYHTTMDYWDYTQHYYTTTKVKLLPVVVGCTKIEYSDGSNKIITKGYKGTLEGIVNPEFGGALLVNGKKPDAFGGLLIPASDKLELKGLEYINVGKIGGKDIAINKIEASIKENDITLGKATINIQTKKTKGPFGTLEFLIKNDKDEVITQKRGNYQVVFTFFDGNQQIGTYELPLMVIPNNNIQALGGISVVNNDVYADNQSTIQLCQKVQDSFGNNFDKHDDNFPTNIVTVTQGIYSNQINKSGGEAVQVTSVAMQDSEICFDIVSKSPQSKMLTFDIQFPTHQENVDMKWDGGFQKLSSIQTAQNLVFKKPFSGILQVSNDSGITWDGKPKVGTTQEYIIRFIKEIPRIVYSLNISTDTIKHKKVGHFFTNFVFDGGNKFDARIDANSDILGSPLVSTQNLIISYTLGGTPVQYYLDDMEILGENQDTLGLRIVGSLQGSGKGEMTGQQENFSDIGSSELRAQIRKNAHTLIKGRQSGTVVNGVKYVEGDSIINGNENFETLIVKDGNVIIRGNIEKTLGIIVLKDNYRTETDFSQQGNVYVQSNVGYMDAIIYADGGFISADEGGLPYITDSSARTSALQNQLVLKGSLFTRNTIGGAIGAGGNYQLPGEATTNDFNKAMVYDLNYLRTGDNGANEQRNEGYTDPFLIIYNPKVQTNPPKGF